MSDHQVDSLGHMLRMKLMGPEERLREWAFRRLSLPKMMSVSAARTACLLAVGDAQKEGREFTLIHWYFVDMDTTPIMTMWDMNER